MDKEFHARTNSIIITAFIIALIIFFATYTNKTTNYKQNQTPKTIYDYTLELIPESETKDNSGYSSIAKMTGGTYQRINAEETQEAMSISTDFNLLYDQVLLSKTTQIRNHFQEYTFETTEDTTEIAILANSYTGNLHITLMDPNQNIVKNEMQETNITTTSNAGLIEIYEPAEGQWKIIIQGNSEYKIEVKANER